MQIIIEIVMGAFTIFIGIRVFGFLLSMEVNKK